MFFVKTQRTPTQTDTTIISVYSLSLVIIITGHLILTKHSKSGRFVHFFALERQSDSPRKTSTLRCQMQAQRATFYIDCRKMVFTSEHRRFIIKSYFRNGVLNNAEWSDSAVACLAEFWQNFSNLNINRYTGCLVFKITNFSDMHS
jgi:hypothetical protein